jgi:DNA-damage-inducible protein J
MSTVNVTFRVDDELKKQADALFSDLGMSLSTAFNVFLRQSVREQQIPFAVSRNVPNAVTFAAMDATEKDEEMQDPFERLDDLMEALHT